MTVVDCAEPVDGVALTLKVYAPVVVPAFVPPPMPELPLQLIPAAATTRSNTARGTSRNRRSLETKKRKKMLARQIPIPARGQARPEGYFGGLTKICAAAVEEQVIVALPVSDEVVKAIVFGAVKF